MKKLAILAAAAIGYALANRVGRKQDLGFSGPTPARPDYAPAGADPFVASAQEVPLRVVEDLPEEPVADEIEPEPVLDEPVAEEPVEDEATPEVEDTDSAPSDDLAEEPVVEEVFAPVEADPHALSDAAVEVAAEVDEAIEAELNAEPAVEPIIEDIVPSTPVAETEEEPEVTSPELSESAEASPEVEQVSPPPLAEDSATEDSAAETEASTSTSTWGELWVNDMPAPEVHEQTPADEPASEVGEDSDSTLEASPERKLSEIAEGINERIRTAAELAREEEPAVENFDELESDVDALDSEEASAEVFVVPTVGDFADEVFEDEVAGEAGTAADLGETALMDAIDDESDKA